MNLLQFTKRFPDEQSCINHLKDLRLKQGITCKKCDQQTKHYWLESVNKFQCSVCRSRTNIKSGTIMEKSKLPLTIWFTVIHFMTSTKKSFSSLELQRQLGLSSYQSVWYMVMKIRSVMGKRDNLYTLNGDIEIDEGFFTTVNFERERDRHGNVIVKRGRGSNKSKVLVMVESRPVEHNIKHKKKRVLGYIKMVTMDGLTSKDINYEVGKSIDRNSTLYTDGWRGYSNITDVVDNHVP